MDGALREAGIEYRHAGELGGRRQAPKNAEPTAWRNAGFHAYATYMRSAEFKSAIDHLVALAREHRTVIMCSEAVPWRCHRNLIADAIVARDVTVLHINDSGVSSHALTSFAVVDGTDVRYPPEPADDAKQLDLRV